MVADFECVPAGRSALLRVSLGEPVDPRGAVLVVGHGPSVTLVDALPAPLTSGALGFACARETVEGEPDYWLQADGVTHALGQPR